MDQAFKKAEEIQRSDNEILHIGDFSTSGANVYLFPQLSFFQNSHPEVNVDINQADYESLRSGIISGRYDVIFIPMYMRSFFERDDLQIVPAMLAKPAIVISKYHYLYSERTAKYTDFLDDTAVMLGGKTYELYDRMAEEVLQKIEFRGQRIHQAKNTMEMATQLLHDHRFLIGNLLFSPVGKEQYRTIPLPGIDLNNWGIDIVFRKENKDDLISALMDCYRSTKINSVVH